MSTHSKPTQIHWRFKKETGAAEQNLCDTAPAELRATNSIVFRPVIRQEYRGPFRECVRCAKIGKKLGIVPSQPNDEDDDDSDHSPLINRDLTAIIGCTCGWRTPPGSTDSDTAFSVHAATALVAKVGRREAFQRCASVLRNHGARSGSSRREGYAVDGRRESPTTWLRGGRRHRDPIE